jgi:Abortive infection alpha
VVRFERQVRLAERVRKFLVERGLRDPTRTIPLKVVLPLLDYATLEEDDELHDVWAMLLLNGGDADSGIEMRRAFVSVLAEMTRLDVGNLATIEQASPVYPNGSSAAVWTTQLPEKATPADRRDRDVVNTDPTLEVLTSLSNLESLGCIYSVSDEVRSGGAIPSALRRLLHSAERSSRLAHTVRMLDPARRASVEIRHLREFASR